MSLKTKFYNLNQVGPTDGPGLTPDKVQIVLDELNTIHSAPIEVPDITYTLIDQDLYLDNLIITFGEESNLIIIGGVNPIIDDFHIEAIVNVVHRQVDVSYHLHTLFVETLVEYNQ